MHLTARDLDMAIEVCKNSDVCTGSLREDSEQGKNNAYCIMGTIIQGFAKNRHISFGKACNILDFSGAGLELERRIEESFEDDRLSRLVSGNDSHFDNSKGKITKKWALKRWQLRKLSLLRSKLAKKPMDLNT